MSEEIPTEEFKLEQDLNLSSEFLHPSFEEWKAQVEKDLQGASYEKKLVTKTYEGIDLQPIYTKKDLEKSLIADDLPGSNSFVRGHYFTGYHKKSWDVNQEIALADAEEFNSALIEGLNNGQNCINVSLDTATKLGMDADYASPEQVGDRGLSISAMSSMKRAFNNIDLISLPLYVDAGYDAIPFLSLINAHFEASNLDISQLDGAITSDPIAHLAVYGDLPVSIDFLFDMMKNSIDWKNKCAPKVKTLGINTLPFVNSGANSVQELAFAISTAVFYLNELTARNISAKDVMNSIQFTLGINTNYFMEIAKFRAIKVLLKNIASEYGIKDEELKLNIGAKSSTYTQTALDPYVNMLRTTTQSFSAILGGVNNITTSPFDETVRISDSFSRRIARNTQTILREESHLDQVIDAAGGSYYIESLTEEIAKKAWELFQKIEEDGGIFEALKKGTIQSSVEEIAQLKEKDINKRKNVIVGTNMFADVKELKLKERKLNSTEFQKKRANYLEKFRLNGSKEKHEAVMEKLDAISSLNSAEIIDVITEAYLLGTTIGEISSSLYSSHKEETKIDKLKQRRASENFEELRTIASKYKTKNGCLPKVYLANYGSIKEYKGRADFSKGFFEVGGFDVIDPNGISNTEEIVKQTIDSGAPIAVICSSDDIYPEIVPDLVKGLKEKNPKIQVILAGYPKDQIEEHKKSGIDDFIFLGADAMTILTSLYNKIGGTK
ncbi:MAG: acyl-CoA mutase large subunit family protein [Melioribacteraceae bacterium]|nr:acyl-CoA mutase large subunit family protein [Melioribacteraceae bacterium]